MGSPLDTITAFREELKRYLPYEYSEMLRSDPSHLERDDVIALLKDFRAVDILYNKHMDALDLSLQLKVHLAREKIAARVEEVTGLVAKREGPGDWTEVMEADAIVRIAQYPILVRDVVEEQMRRYGVLLAEDLELASGKSRGNSSSR